MANNKRTGKFYRKNEAEVMRSLGLVPTKNSGSGWIEKEDGQNEYIIAQLKSTDAESIRLVLNDIHKLEYNAAVAHKVPLFVIQFLGTGEIFILAKPLDMKSVVQYIECGECALRSQETIFDDNSGKEEVNPIPVISSSVEGRKDFWEEKSKEWKNNARSARGKV